MAVGKKLLLSLSVFAIRQRKRLPDGSLVKRSPLTPPNAVVPRVPGRMPDHGRGRGTPSCLT